MVSFITAKWTSFSILNVLAATSLQFSPSTRPKPTHHRGHNQCEYMQKLHSLMCRVERGATTQHSLTSLTSQQTKQQNSRSSSRAAVSGRRSCVQREKKFRKKHQQKHVKRYMSAYQQTNSAAKKLHYYYYYIEHCVAFV